MHGQFLGFVSLASAIRGSFLVRNTSDTPIDADSAPTYRVYGPSGFLSGQSGTLSTFKDTAALTNATNASPIVITSVAHKLTTGARVTISGVGGNTAANTTAVATVLSADTFSIPVAGNGAYTSGGTWHVSGLYDFSLTPTGASGYESGKCYTVFLHYAISSTATAQVATFVVT